MQWGQIKSLLILSFLILDVYLFLQFLDKKEQADIAVLEEEPSSIEEQLSAEDITIEALPEEVEEESYISVKQQLFKEEELEDYDENVAQHTYLFDQYFIASQLDEPIPINRQATSEDITEIFNEIAYYPEEYKYWNW